MAFTALDTSQKSSGLIDCMKARGIAAIGRYYTKNRGNSKILTTDEARRLSDAGIRIWPVYQNRHRLPADFSATKGKQEAEDALDYAMNVINQPTGSGIYFSADFDATEAVFGSAIKPHFEAIAAAFARAGDPYRIGVYGSGAVCRSLLDLGLAQLSWLSQSSGFRGTQQFKASRRWNILQALPVSDFCGFDDDVDPNTINVDVGDFGGFILGQAAQPQSAAPLEARAAVAQSMPYPLIPSLPVSQFFVVGRFIRGNWVRTM